MIMIQVKHKKILMFTSFLVTIAICVATVFGAQKLSKTWRARFVNLHPKKTLVVRIDLSQQEKFFEQLTRFADADTFDIHIGPTTPSDDTFNINMSRKDVELIANNSAVDIRNFDIAFYDKDPTNPVSEKIIDDLLNDLKRYISEIPNAIVTEQRKSLRITLDESQREELFAQMRKLADEHSLEFKLSISSDKSVFHIEIHGEGFHITSDPVVGSPREILIIFFIDYEKAPTPTSLEAVDKLFDELKNLLGKIANVMVTEEK
jgi:hypothetical protein